MLDREEQNLLEALEANQGLFDYSKDAVSDFMIRHLSLERQNVLLWYPFIKDSRILILDAEYGELLQALSAKALLVDAVYLSENNLVISQKRNSHLDNVRYYKFKDYGLSQYDYIIVNDLSYIQDINCPLDSFFNNLSGHITNGQILVLADNKLALNKILNIKVNHVSSCEVTKRDFVDVIKSSGLECSKIYYPYPDRFYTTEIFTDVNVNSSSFGRMAYVFESKVLENDILGNNYEIYKREGIVDEVAPSYLFVLTGEFNRDDVDIQYVKLSTDRNNEFKIYTQIEEDAFGKIVRKVPLTEISKSHLKAVSSVDISIDKARILHGKLGVDGSVIYPYLQLDNLDKRFQRAVNSLDLEGCKLILDEVYNRFLTNSENVNYRTDLFKKIFGPVQIELDLESKKGMDIDLILDNIFVEEDGSFTVIDPEWTFDFYIPVKYVMWRILNECFYRYPKLEQVISRTDFMETYGINQVMERAFFAWEIHFINEYVGANKFANYQKGYIGKLTNMYVENVGLYNETSTLYYKDATGQRKSVVCSSTMEGDIFKFRFDISEIGSLRELRWDPCEHKCKCINVRGCVDGREIELNPINSIYRAESEVYFTSDDPCFVINEDIVGERLNIQAKIVPMKLDDINELAVKYGSLIANNTILKNELESIYNSKLWRVRNMIVFIKSGLKRVRRVLGRIKRHILRKIYSNHTNQNENIVEVINKYMVSEKETEQINYEGTIDVIVPIYNGYDYLVKLFPTLLKTKLSTRIFLVDDKSPDERVHEIEKKFAEQNTNVILLENEENYGFVKTVNNALQKTENHVALINTDTELPDMWLERLMAPILKDSKVGSTTPYTNSATIFSFPNFCYNNEIYRGMTVDEIDEFFRMVKPQNAVAPTGVGFCMGMSREALDKVGILDYETFSKGFGEENDWCQRAVRKGYKNVHVENLFVYHKHGGSFMSKEKEALLKKNVAIVNSRYPNYERDVQHYVMRDSNRSIRELAQMYLDMKDSSCKSILVFDHMLGGGATAYLNNKIRKHVQSGDAVVCVRYDLNANCYHFEYKSNKFEKKYIFKDLNDLFIVVKYFHFDEIYVNELVTYPLIENVLKTILKLKEVTGARLVMLGHDYFMLCPSVTLMGQNDCYCDFPEDNVCNECFIKRNYNVNFQCSSLKEWHKRWKTFLEGCDEVRAFSEDTLNRIKEIMGEKITYTLVPHKVEYMFPINKNFKTTDTYNIGVLGHLAVHKGSEIVRAMLEELADKDVYDVKIVLIGSVDDPELLKYENFVQTGEYFAEDIVRHTYENDIDVFLIPSVWPETFSYTTEEIMKMNMPVACFNIGAPADRVREYDKGVIIPEMSGEEALKTLIAKKSVYEKPRIDNHKRVVYVVEYKSFSSRYRIEHMKEELLAQGFDGEIWYTDNLPKNINWNQISTVVLYRCRWLKPVVGLVEDIKSHGITIGYDIDDLIFDYDSIKNLDFMKDPEYKDFEQYSRDIHKCIEQMDYVLTSTDTLKAELEKSFKDKKVILNRNRASSAMTMLALKARLNKNSNKKEVVLGYFSGSHTHNADFDLISDVLLDVMKDNANVRLLIVGCLKLDSKFEQVKDQIKRVDFVDWRKLHEIIASCDINLMPLEDTVFHRSKSENKWMEAAFSEVPTIASYNSEMAANTVDRGNIILCNGNEEWHEQLLELINNEDYRNKIARAAYETVMTDKVTVEIKGLWEQISAELI